MVRNRSRRLVQELSWGIYLVTKESNRLNSVGSSGRHNRLSRGAEAGLGERFGNPDFRGQLEEAGYMLVWFLMPHAITAYPVQITPQKLLDP